MNTFNSSPQGLLLSHKFKQLSLEFDFDDGSAICPYNPPDNLKVCKLIAPIEMGKHPFFLTSRTAITKRSRIGYMKNKIRIDMESKGFSRAQIEEATKHEIHAYDLFLALKDGWVITAHHNYGFPDLLDGYVFDYILNLITSVYNRKHSFFLVYLLKLSDVVDHLIKLNVYNNKDGRLYKRVRDCFYRLKNTTYTLSKGHYLRSSNSFHTSYTFNLISTIFEKGSLLPNGSACASFAIALDPLMLYNFRSNYFFILLNEVRSKITDYSAKMLFDRLSYLSYIAIKKYDFALCLNHNLPFFLSLKYDNLCEYFGYTPLSKSNLSKSKILKQFSPQVESLISAGCIQEFLIDTTIKNSIRLIFVLKKEFVLDVVNILSKEKALDFFSFTHSVEKSNNFFKKTTLLIPSPKIRSYLFPRKKENLNLLVEETEFSDIEIEKEDLQAEKDRLF